MLDAPNPLCNRWAPLKELLETLWGPKTLCEGLTHPGSKGDQIRNFPISSENRQAPPPPRATLQWGCPCQPSPLKGGVHAVMSDSATPWIEVDQVPLSMGFSGKNTGVSCHFLLQGIFPTQESNPRLLHFLHWQADSLPLSHQGGKEGVHKSPMPRPVLECLQSPQVIPISSKASGLTALP